VHTGDKPYKCTFGQCDKAFTQRAGLNYHRKLHETSDKRFDCRLCALSAASEAGLSEHYAGAHQMTDLVVSASDGRDEQQSSHSEESQVEKRIVLPLPSPPVQSGDAVFLEKPISSVVSPPLPSFDHLKQNSPNAPRYHDSSYVLDGPLQYNQEQPVSNAANRGNASPPLTPPTSTTSANQIDELMQHQQDDFLPAISISDDLAGQLYSPASTATTAASYVNEVSSQIGAYGNSSDSSSLQHHQHQHQEEREQQQMYHHQHQQSQLQHQYNNGFQHFNHQIQQHQHGYNNSYSSTAALATATAAGTTAQQQHFNSYYSDQQQQQQQQHCYNQHNHLQHHLGVGVGLHQQQQMTSTSAASYSTSASASASAADQMASTGGGYDYRATAARARQQQSGYCI
jgi:hypothetical protein